MNELKTNFKEAKGFKLATLFPKSIVAGTDKFRQKEP